jgi:predicted DCC family thiol-disulfide oxidoreductase YuxK
VNSFDQKIILFDGFCRLCSGAVDFIAAHDKKNVFHYVALQSPEAKSLLDEVQFHQSGPGTLLYIEKGQVTTQSTAVLKIAKQLDFPFQWAGILMAVPQPLRDAAYRFIATRRTKWFGKRSTCRTHVDR